MQLEIWKLIHAFMAAVHNRLLQSNCSMLCLKVRLHRMRCVAVPRCERIRCERTLTLCVL